MTEGAAEVDAYIGLGANLGDARATLAAALTAIDALPNSRLVRSSALYVSAPVDSSGPDYFNAVAHVCTRLGPHDLLARLQAIELDHGRERPHRNAPRTLDLDLLMYGDDCQHSASLTLPHPRLHERAFVLRPLAEIAPGLRIPGRAPLPDLLRNVADQRIERAPA